MVFWSCILSLHLLFLIPDITQERNNIIVGATVGAGGGAVIVLAFVICFVCVIVSCIKYKRQIKLEKLHRMKETRWELRKTEEMNCEDWWPIEETNRDYYEKVSLKELELHINFIKKALPHISDFETLQCFLDFLHEIVQEGLKNRTIKPGITEVVNKALGTSCSKCTPV